MCSLLKLFQCISILVLVTESRGQPTGRPETPDPGDPDTIRDAVFKSIGKDFKIAKVIHGKAEIKQFIKENPVNYLVLGPPDPDMPNPEPSQLKKLKVINDVSNKAKILDYLKTNGNSIPPNLLTIDEKPASSIDSNLAASSSSSSKPPQNPTNAQQTVNTGSEASPSQQKPASNPTSVSEKPQVSQNNPQNSQLQSEAKPVEVSQPPQNSVQEAPQGGNTNPVNPTSNQTPTENTSQKPPPRLQRLGSFSNVGEILGSTRPVEKPTEDLPNKPDIAQPQNIGETPGNTDTNQEYNNVPSSETSNSDTDTIISLNEKTGQVSINEVHHQPSSSNPATDVSEERPQLTSEPEQISSETQPGSNVPETNPGGIVDSPEAAVETPAVSISVSGDGVSLQEVPPEKKRPANTRINSFVSGLVDNEGNTVLEYVERPKPPRKHSTHYDMLDGFFDPSGNNLLKKGTHFF